MYTLDNTSFLITILFSFTIVFISYPINKEPYLANSLGLLFLIPLVANLYYSFFSDNLTATIIVPFSESLAFFLLFLLLLFNPDKISFTPTTLIIFFLAIIFINLSNYENLIIANAHIFRMFQYAAILGVLASLYLAKRNGLNKLIVPLILIFPALLISTWPNSNITTYYAALICRFAAYLGLLLFLYRESNLQLYRRVVEAEEKLNNWDKSIRREVSKRIHDLEAYNTKLRDMNKLDPLTQMYNKINIIQIIDTLCQEKNRRPFTILMFDIDNFKQINDTFGHLTGDEVIKKVASVSQNCIRQVDSLGRYGGDEFIIVLPETNINDARFVAERLRKNIEQDPAANCTISVGIATFPANGDNSTALLKVADGGLYISKENGRNLVSYMN